MYYYSQPNKTCEHHRFIISSFVDGEWGSRASAGSKCPRIDFLVTLRVYYNLVSTDKALGQLEMLTLINHQL